MKTFALKCPNCNGDLTIEDGLDTFFCMYCGYKIMLDHAIQGDTLVAPYFT